MTLHRLLLFACVLCGGCRSTSPTPPVIPPPGAAPGVYVLNEGGFSGGGGVSFYDLGRDTVYQNAIPGADGWVFPNDMKTFGTRGYVAVNGADKIDIVDIASQTITGSIAFPHFSGPEFMAAMGETLYVANFDGSVTAVDLRADTLLRTVPGVVGFPGGIACLEGKVFVSDVGLYPSVGTAVKVLLPGSSSVSASISVDNAPGPLVVIGGKLAVVCTGTSRLYRVDPGTFGIIDSLQLGMYLSDCATDGEYLYVLGSDSVAKVEDNPLSLINSGLIRRAAGSYFYAIGVERPAGVIYVSNILAAGGSGRVESYRTDGTVRRPPFPVGVFPGAFAFRP